MQLSSTWPSRRRRRRTLKVRLKRERASNKCKCDKISVYLIRSYNNYQHEWCLVAAACRRRRCCCCFLLACLCHTHTRVISPLVAIVFCIKIHLLLLLLLLLASKQARESNDIHCKSVRKRERERARKNLVVFVVVASGRKLKKLPPTTSKFLCE